MVRVPTAGRFRWVRMLPMVAVMAILVVGVFPLAAGAANVPTPVAGALVGTGPLTHTPGSPVLHSAAGGSPVSLASAHPAWSPSGVTLGFYQNNSTFAVPPAAQIACQSLNYTFEISNTCGPEAVSPSIVTLANGNVGVGYSLEANVPGTSTSGCVTPTNNLVQERVGFSISPDNGTHYGAINYLGNETCSYLDAIEPSFAVGSTGTVYGAYIEENFSGNQGDYINPTSYYYYGSTTGNRSTDALGFTVSKDNGTTFSNPVTINSNGWIAKPQVAVFGESVYVLFENISNSSTGAVVPYGYSFNTGTPIGLYVLYSPDGGATWRGPYTVPGVVGLSGTAQETGGAIAVNATGEVAISYFTNDSCGETDFGFCEREALDLVVATSTTNGSTFHGPYTVFHQAGSTDGYLPYYMQGNFQQLPESTIAFSTSGESLYVAWSAPYNNSALFGFPWTYYTGFESSGTFSAAGPSTATTWTVSIVSATAQTYSEEYDYSPALGVSGSTVYLTYTTENETYCYGSGCPYLASSVAQVVESSSNGLTWSGPSYPTFVKPSGGIYSTDLSFPGLSSAVGFSAGGTPLFGYSLPQGETSSFYYNGIAIYNYTYPTTLYVATNYVGPTVSINVTEGFLIPGTAWSVIIDGALINVPAGTTNFTLNGIAVNQTLLVSADQLDAAYAEIAFPTVSIGGAPAGQSAAQFVQNGSIFVNYTFEYGVTVNFEPNNPYEAEVSINSGTYEYYEVSTYYPNGYWYPNEFPWYFPVNSSVQLISYGYPTAGSLWSGVGIGNYSGPGAWANITMGGPINETVWFSAASQYNVTVQAPTLPLSSTYHFTLDGTAHTAAAGSIVNVSSLETGPHALTNVWATSATAGWEYVGAYPESFPVLVPNTLLLNLSFSLIDISVPAGPVSFQAQGLTLGTVWQFSFNGTTYSSATPWINVTTHPGTYATAAFPVVSSNASVGYAPSGVPTSWAVTTGGSYVVDFTQAYRVASVAGNGGTVSGGSTLWLASGATASFMASAKTGYAFGSWAGVGLGSYSGTSPWANVTVGGPITEVATFAPLSNDRFNVTFTESGIPSGTWWTVQLGPVGYSSDVPLLTISNLPACGSPGANYNLSVPYSYAGGQLTRYVPTSGLPRVICASGQTEHEVFAPQFFLTIQATPGGFGEATIGAFTTTTGVWVAQGATVSLSEFSQPGYTFLGWNGTGFGNYTGPSESQTVILAGPVTEVAAFALPVIPPTPKYTVDFHLAVPLAAGTAWTVTVGGTGYTSTGADLIVGGLGAGQYSLSISTVTDPTGTIQFAPSGDPTSVSVIHNATVGISFSISYWVSISASAGGVTPTHSGWIKSGSTILLNASANDGYTFVAWTGTGRSSYTGPLSQDSFPVTASITEVATFAPTGGNGQTGTTSGSQSLWSAPTTWLGLGIVGLLVGLVIGLMVSRRSGRSPPPASAAPASESAQESYGEPLPSPEQNR